ncbi:hypothetical protein SAICODRAFT_31181 [Saitoella complicata NRRL Y-17804]|nr:uncharacterized protein SAICODRAFT_31181 [Saitoella complicata NRRL Y-17804]ODQ51503.1 hypothetical protein SAICODRAFT_31181 [Saitoella complicata NRRL Y-17804]
MAIYPFDVSLSSPPPPAAVSVMDSIATVVDTELRIPISEPLTPPRTPARKVKVVHERSTLRRRELLLQGKEGSRARRRFENSLLLNNPWATPPSRQDWVPTPDSSRRFRRVEWSLVERMEALNVGSKGGKNREQVRSGVEGVTKGLKARVKKAHVPTDLIRSIEAELRKLLEFTTCPNLDKPSPPVPTTVEEEILFTPRRKSTTSPSLSTTPSPNSTTPPTPPIELEFPLANIPEPEASYHRWILHQICTYYNVKSWSKDVGKRRVAVLRPEAGDGRRVLKDRWFWEVVGEA